MDIDNYVTVLETSAITTLLKVAQVKTKKVSGLDHVLLTRKWGVSHKKILNKIHCTMQHGVSTVMHPSLSRPFRITNHLLGLRSLPHDVYNDTLFATTVSRRDSVQRYLPPILVGHAHSQ